MKLVRKFLSKFLINPTWDYKNGSVRLKRLKELKSYQGQTLKDKENRQNSALIALLQYAKVASPYYKEILADLPEVISDVNYTMSKLPVLTKEKFREKESQMISKDYSRQSLVSSKTGGSTGKPLNLYFDKVCQQKRNAAEMYSDHIAGVSIGDLRLAVWGNPPEQSSFKDWFRESLLNPILYLDTMLLNDNSMEAIIESNKSRKIDYIFGHAHSIYMLAKFTKERRINNFVVNTVISTSMMLLEHERVLIEDAFHCKVFDRYGCEEVGLIAYECKCHKGYHINSEDIYLEILDESGFPVKPGEPGKVVVTDLNNYGMPLIRYSIEDVATLTKEKCECGVEGELLTQINGRVADFLIKPDKTKVAGISLVERILTAFPGLEQMQLIQPSLYEIKVNYVSTEPDLDLVLKNIRSEIQNIFGISVNVSFNKVNELKQEKSGKYRFAICGVENEK